MRTTLEQKLVGLLQEYMGKEGISQVELASRLGWSPSDLNDTLRGRKTIGKNRQHHILSWLGLAIDLDESMAIRKVDSGPYLSIPRRGKRSFETNEDQKIYSTSLSKDTLEIAQLAKHLSKKQKEALKTIIQSMIQKNKKAD